MKLTEEMLKTLVVNTCKFCNSVTDDVPARDVAMTVLLTKALGGIGDMELRRLLLNFDKKEAKEK